MAFAVVGGAGVSTEAKSQTKTSAAITVGDMLSEGGTGLLRSTSADTTAGATHFEAIAFSTQVAADAEVLAVKLTPGMLILADCTNDTAANQVGRRRPLTNQSTLNNTSTDSNATTAPFEIVSIVGPAAQRQVLCRFLGTGQLQNS